jgi:hypothetical protein
VSVEHWNTQLDGPFSGSTVRHKLEMRGYRVTRHDYPRGTYFPRHKADTDKIDADISGRFRLTQSDRSFVEAEVVGDQTVVSLDASRNA